MANYRFPGEHMYENMVLEANQLVESIEKIKQLQTVDGDILIASYPKTGTTWMEEITWLVCNNADTEGASSIRLTDRMLFLEFTHSYHNGKAGIDLLKTKKRPMIMKTHLTSNIWEKTVNEGKLKTIVTVRNPKDTLVSMYHFYRMNSGLGNFPGSWDEFFELYQTKHVLNGDFFDWYLGWMKLFDKDNILVVTYEDMKTDAAVVIRRVSNFLGKDLTDEQVGEIIEHTSFNSMKSNKMVNNEGDSALKTEIAGFIRKGIVGDWKNHFSPEQSRYVDQEYEEKLKCKGLELRFE